MRIIPWRRTRGPATSSQMSPIETAEEWRDLYLATYERLAWHEVRWNIRQKRYKRLASWFRFTIPLLSFALTVIISTDLTHRVGAAQLAATALTLVAVVNSVSNPANRYRTFAGLLVDRHDLYIEFEAGVRKGHDSSPAQMIDFIESIDRRMSLLGARAVDAPLPSVV